MGEPIRARGMLQAVRSGPGRARATRRDGDSAAGPGPVPTSADLRGRDRDPPRTTVGNRPSAEAIRGRLDALSGGG